MKKKILFASALALSITLFSCNSSEEPTVEDKTETVDDTALNEEAQESEDMEVVEEKKEVSKTDANREKSAEEKKADEIKKAEEDALTKGRGKDSKMKGDKLSNQVDEEALEKAIEIKQAEEDALKNRTSGKGKKKQL